MQMGHKSNSINESFPLCISRGVSCTSSMPSPFRMSCMGLPRCRRRGSSRPSPSLSKLPSLHRAFFTFLSQEFFVSVPFFGFGPIRILHFGPDRFVLHQKFQNQFARISSASRNLLNQTLISSSVSGPRAAEPRVHDGGDRHRGRDLLALHRPPRPHERVPRPGAQRAGKSHFQLTG